MNISMVGRQVELTDAIKQQIEASIDSLNKYNLDIISVRAIASGEEKKGHKGKGVSIEFTINLPNKNTIVIKQSDDDLYAAIDVAASRAQKALARHHERIRDHKKDGINEAKAATKDIHMSDERLALEDEIVPLELDLYKPQEVQDVLENLKESDKQFEIFNDIEGKTRVLYKRKDGRFGLY
jgi:putative sigma-54 modulation protein